MRWKPHVREAGRGNGPGESRAPRRGPTSHRAPISEGKVYCCAVLDICSRRVVSWSIDANQTAGPVTSALGMAIDSRRPPPGTVIHSDQGVQFGCWVFTELTKASGLVPSMGSVGDCYDGMIEAFWSCMKVELLDRRRWRTRLELANAMFDYWRSGPQHGREGRAGGGSGSCRAHIKWQNQYGSSSRTSTVISSWTAPRAQRDLVNQWKFRGRVVPASGGRTSVTNLDWSMNSGADSRDGRVRYRYVPAVFSHGDGPHVWDVEGNCYLDLTGSSGTNILGHREPRTTLAAVAALTNGGFLFDGRSADELAVAETLARLYRAKEVQFFRTGSCATSAAVKVMRIASNKDLVLTSGYHGWHDWFTERARHPDSGRVIDFGYDLDVLRHILEGNAVGGIIVTLLAHTFAPSYWHELRELATSAGVLLAVDEIKTGIRYGLGGMSQSVGVTPDITILSKGLTNGMALSAFVDHSGLLKHAATTNLGGTYRTERLPFAAALAMLQLLESQPDVFDRLARITDQFVMDMTAVLEEKQIGAAVFGRSGDLEFICESPSLWDELRIVGLGMRLLLPDDGNIMLTAAHQLEHLEVAIDALESALSRCADSTVAGEGGRVTEKALQREYGVTSRQIADWGTPEVQAVLSRHRGA